MASGAENAGSEMERGGGAPADAISRCCFSWKSSSSSRSEEYGDDRSPPISDRF